MKAYIQLLAGVLFFYLTFGHNLEPMTAADDSSVSDEAREDAAISQVIRPGVKRSRPSKEISDLTPERRMASADEVRMGGEEFGLAPTLTTREGEADLNALTGALRAYVADRMVPASSIQDLRVLVENHFVERLPQPPAGMKYAWDRRLQVTLVANN